jgi:hypothetical protein
MFCSPFGIASTIERVFLGDYDSLIQFRFACGFYDSAEGAERSEASEAADFCDALCQRYHAEHGVSYGS